MEGWRLSPIHAFTFRCAGPWGWRGGGVGRFTSFPWGSDLLFLFSFFLKAKKSPPLHHHPSPAGLGRQLCTYSLPLPMHSASGVSVTLPGLGTTTQPRQTHCGPVPPGGNPQPSRRPWRLSPASEILPAATSGGVTCSLASGSLRDGGDAPSGHQHSDNHDRWVGRLEPPASPIGPHSTGRWHRIVGDVHPGRSPLQIRLTGEMVFQLRHSVPRLRPEPPTSWTSPKVAIQNPTDGGRALAQSSRRESRS